MKKRSKFLAMLLSTAVAVSSLTGISVFAADKTGEEETRTVVDATGAEVEVPAHPKRIAVPAMVLPNIVYALQGNAENIVSIPPAAYSGWEMSILKDLAPELEDVDTTMVNDDFSVNVEALADADIDLVLNWDSETDQAEQLKALGIPCVLVSSAKDMDGLKNLVTMLGDALNCEDRAKQATDWYDETMDYFDSKADEVAALSEDEMPRVLHFQRVHEMTCFTGGINTYITTLEGGQNFTLPEDSGINTKQHIGLVACHLWCFLVYDYFFLFQFRLLNLIQPGRNLSIHIQPANKQQQYNDFKHKQYFFLFSWFSHAFFPLS